MRVFYGLDNLPHFRSPVVTVGSFDGVHVGHRQLLKQLESVAADAGGETVVMTFASHPRMVLSAETDLKLLTTLEEKILLLSETGVGNLIVMPFDLQFSRLTPERFVEDILIGKVGAAGMVVGYNHHFGHNKEGDFRYLSHMHERFGFRIFEAPKFEADGMKVSSTVIREFIRQGDMNLAGKLLGRPYMVMAHRDSSGSIVSGSEHKLLPCDGTYDVEIDSERTSLEIFSGAMSLSPTPAIPSEGKFLINFL